MARDKKLVISERVLARRLALQAVYQREMTSDSCSEVIKQFASCDAYKNADREYFCLLVRASEQYREQVESLLSPYLRSSFAQIDPVERAILRNAVYEIIHVDDVEGKVAVSEAVRLSKRFGSSGGYRFVNGVLDAFLKAETRRQQHPRPPVSETSIIEKYFKKKCEGNVILGSGDDAAIVKFGNQRLVATTDTLVEGTHFEAGEDPVALGHKALAVNLSDLAAMGARPLWLLLTLTVAEQSEDWFAAFSKGFFALAEEFAVELIGGDLVRGQLAITVCALGRSSGHFMPRSGAAPGDVIFVTGNVGGAAFALRFANAMKRLPANIAADCLDKLRFPRPRVLEGLKISRYASAATDISDGLLLNLSHIISASDVGAVIHLDSIPYHPALNDSLDNSELLLECLAGGEDYELLCMAPKERAAKFEKALAAENMKITRIGEITDSKKLECRFAGLPRELPKKLGYDQFCPQGLI